MYLIPTVHGSCKSCIRYCFVQLVLEQLRGVYAVPPAGTDWKYFSLFPPSGPLLALYEERARFLCPWKSGRLLLSGH